jgi:hypothetical protein
VYREPLVPPRRAASTRPLQLSREFRPGGRFEDLDLSISGQGVGKKIAAILRQREVVCGLHHRGLHHYRAAATESAGDAHSELHVSGEELPCSLGDASLYSSSFLSVQRSCTVTSMSAAS